MTSTAQNPESVGCQNGAFVVSQNLGTFLKEMASNISSDKACKRKSLLLVLTIFGRTKGAQNRPVYSHRWEIPDIGTLSWESCTLRGVDQTRARSVSPPPFNSLLFLPLPSLPLFSTPSSLSSFPPPFLIDETQPPLKVWSRSGGEESIPSGEAIDDGLSCSQNKCLFWELSDWNKGVAGTGDFDGKEGTNDLGRGGDFCLGTSSKFSGQGLVWGT